VDHVRKWEHGEPCKITLGGALGEMLGMGGVGLSRVAEAGIQWEGEPSSGVKGSRATRGGTEDIRRTPPCRLPYPLVASWDSGSVRRTARMRISLHSPWSLPLESFYRLSG
jgi:hypothetical protein